MPFIFTALTALIISVYLAPASAQYSIPPGSAQYAIFGSGQASYPLLIPPVNPLLSSLIFTGLREVNNSQLNLALQTLSSSAAGSFLIRKDDSSIAGAFPVSPAVALESYFLPTAALVNGPGVFSLSGDNFFPTVNNTAAPVALTRVSSGNASFPTTANPLLPASLVAPTAGSLLPASLVVPTAGSLLSASLAPLALADLVNNALKSPFSPFTPFFTGSQVLQPVAALQGGLIPFLSPRIGIRGIDTVASLVLANATYGMYCWDPVSWLDGGFQVGIWNRDLPVRAQSFDKRGFLLDAIPTFSVQPTGQTGSMTLLRDDIFLFQGLINAGGPNDYFTTVTVDTVSAIAVTHRRSASCDICHPSPPGHIANPATWGRCHDCHNLGNVMHVHAYQANIAIDDCYRCHPTGCLSGLHGQIGIWCTNCHGTLLDATNGQMKISGQLGKPYCADCHDPLHAENLPALFVASAGHGGVWCINCHAPTHVESVQPFGYNNCVVCHTVQAKISWMGPDCGACHTSSISPHLVTVP